MSKFRRQLIASSLGEAPVPVPTHLGYVENGLVAMWDGEYNTGLNTEHDSTATNWVDLVNETLSSTLSSQTFGNNYLEVNTDTLHLIESDTPTILPNRPFTVELVAEEVVKATNADTATGGLNVNAAFLLGFFRHNAKLYGPCGYKLGTVYAGKKISGITASTLCPKANKSFVVNNYEGSVTTSNVASCAKVYYNGALQATNLTPFEYGTTPTQTGLISVGVGAGATCRYYSIRIYNRELTASEINSNYQLDVQRFNIA